MWDFYFIFVFMNYWVNSNSGDYIQEFEGKYYLSLISRWVDDKYYPFERIEISKSQFETIKGFVPIKEKKLFSRKRSTYAPTLSDGTKGLSKRVDIPTIQDAREQRLKELGL